jgi:DNA-binding MarR family transcriptional regulator
MQVKSAPGTLLPDLAGTSSCAAYNFRRAARAVSRFYDAVLEPSGIRSTQFAVLTAVAKLRPVAISRISEILVIDPTTLTRSLRLLQKEGLIEIAPRGVRRQRLVTLTTKAEKVLAEAVPLWREAQAGFLASLGGEDWREFKDRLERATQAAIALEHQGFAGARPSPEGPPRPPGRSAAKRSRLSRGTRRRTPKETGPS